MTKRTLRRLVALMVVGGVMASILALTAAPAHALCTANPLTGDWRNINTSSPSMSRVIVETCQPITTCNGNICTTVHDAGTFMTPFGKCTPTDCNWGRRQAENMGDGWIRTIHNFGFKTSHVWAKTYQYYGLTYLRVWVFNDFTPADGRADYTTDEWMLR